MIISFNSAVFVEEYAEDLREAFVLLAKKEQHFVDTASLEQNSNYIYNSQLFENYFSKKEKELVIKTLPQRKPKAIHKTYLTKIRVGNGSNEVKPNDLLRILKERSKIIIENLINDWKFLRGVCDKYTASPQRKPIYLLIQKAIKNEWIEPATGGGDGQIKPVIKHLISSIVYKDIEKYKLMTLFDSDRKFPNPNTLDTKTKIPLVSFLKTGLETSIPTLTFINCVYETTDLILWHILYKRKLENYVPLNVLFNNIHNLTESQKQYLENLTVQELDFDEYYKDKIGIRKDKIKEQFPEMFLTTFSYTDFERICEHHKVNFEGEEITEMEQILLKIAKII